MNEQNNIESNTNNTVENELSSLQLANKIKRANSLAVMKGNAPLMRYFDAQEDSTSSYVLGYN